MRIIILGTGTPHNREGSSAVITIDNNNLLFDCGRWISLKLYQAGISPPQVTHFFFTHIFHFDHTCDYYDFLTYFNFKENANLNIYGPSGTKEYTKELLELHEKYGEGRTKPIHDWSQNHTINVDSGMICLGNDWRVLAANIDKNTKWLPNIAYRVEQGKYSTVIAWDVHPRHDLHLPPRHDRQIRSPFWGFDDSYTSRKELMEIMDGADLVIADVMQGHTTPEGLGIAAKEANVKKLVLTHYGSEDQSNTVERIRSIFNGEIIIGKSLMVIEI